MVSVATVVRWAESTMLASTVPKKSFARSAAVRVGTPDTVAQVPASFLVAGPYRLREPVALTAGLAGGVVLGDEPGPLGDKPGLLGVEPGPLGVTLGLFDADGSSLAEAVGLGVADCGWGIAVGGGSSAGGVLAHPAATTASAAAIVTEIRPQLRPQRG